MVISEHRLVEVPAILAINCMKGPASSKTIGGELDMTAERLHTKVGNGSKDWSCFQYALLNTPGD